MGRATDALLAYGYDLGGPDNEWKVQETDRWGGLTVPWYNADPEDDGDGDDFVETAKRVLAEAGVAGVRFESHCSDSSTSVLLAAAVTTARRGAPVVVDLNDITRRQLAADWYGLLAAALHALGLTPTQGAPAWLLASYTDAL
jgi:hypothetical protein